MLNVILPIFGHVDETFPPNYDNQPLIFLTVNERPIIAWSISHIDPAPVKKRYFVISTEEFIKTNHIDKLLPLYTDNEIIFVRLKQNTKGMPCSILMAMDLIDENEPVLVTSADQYINIDLQEHLDYFQEYECDAGCIGFHSVHSKWSYAEVNKHSLIERVVEKVPVSKNALTSSYYFSSARTMNEAIKANILRGETTQGKFYLSTCLNELIIADKKIAYSKIDAGDYFNFYSKEIVSEFRQYLGRQSNRVEKLTRRYADLFNEKKLTLLKQMFLPEISLEDSFTPNISGVERVVDFFGGLFHSAQTLDFQPQIITAIDSDIGMIKFKLQINDVSFEGVDILKFRGMKLLSISAYLHKVS